ncbi:MAG: hypothetical protein FWC10_10425 [Lentimicrobiaceae bacterium]|nr:hypothetical protein [Lentimicrobiaceae bacterium]
MEITGTKTRVKLPAEKLFEMAGNCQNFSRYVSEQAKDIHATEDSCTFTIENIAKVTLKIVEKTPFTTIRYAADNDKNIPFFLTLFYTKISDNETDVDVKLDLEVPLFLKPVLQAPLQRFMGTLSEKIKTDAEKLES